MIPDTLVDCEVCGQAVYDDELVDGRCRECILPVRDEDTADLDAAREDARNLLEEFEEVADSLRRILEGKGDSGDVRVIRENLDAGGQLFIYGTANWDVLLAGVS